MLSSVAGTITNISPLGVQYIETWPQVIVETVETDSIVAFVCSGISPTWSSSGRCEHCAVLSLNNIQSLLQYVYKVYL